jgi:hypothetical protein
MSDYIKAVLADLAIAKAEFQLRAIAAAMGYPIITRTHFDEATGETVIMQIDPAAFHIIPQDKPPRQPQSSLEPQP